ncbi:MAG: DUF4115 domain-containing protein [Actinobacteria bacterium]|nr:DUF4115 domain-containing protein [Actinomycetota bacterium]
MFEIGDTLREARIRQGMSLKDVEDALKIRGRYLLALEQDDFETLPGSTFVKAFLRTYADFLGLDANVLVSEYVAQRQPDRQEVVRQPVRTSSGPRTRSPRRQPNYVVVAVAALAIIVILALVFRGGDEGPATIDPESVSTTQTTAEGESGNAPDEAVAGVTVAAATLDPPSDRAPDTLDLALRVTQNRCWVVIREGSAEGRTLYSGTLTEGEELTYSSGEGLWFRIGDPSVVVLYVDGLVLEVPEPYGDFLVRESGIRRDE